jgi:hypothetical protein
MALSCTASLFCGLSDNKECAAADAKASGAAAKE